MKPKSKPSKPPSKSKSSKPKSKSKSPKKTYYGYSSKAEWNKKAPLSAIEKQGKLDPKFDYSPMFGRQHPPGYAGVSRDEAASQRVSVVSVRPRLTLAVRSGYALANCALRRGVRRLKNMAFEIMHGPSLASLRTACQTPARRNNTSPARHVHRRPLANQCLTPLWCTTIWSSVSKCSGNAQAPDDRRTFTCTGAAST